MNRIWTTLAATALGATALAQGAEVLYTPTRTIKDQQIGIRNWGSGTVSETDEVAFEGSHSIRISTRNLFQGGTLTLGAPGDLNRSYQDKNNLLRLTFMLADQVGTGGGFPGMPGGGRRPGGGMAPGGGGGMMPGAGGGAMMPGGGQGARGGAGAGARGGVGGVGGLGGARGGQVGGGFPGGGMPGMPGQGGRMGAQNQVDDTLETLRFIITTTDGKKSEAYVPVDTNATAGERGWRMVSIPLQAISGFDRTNKIVREVALSGDATVTFYVGELKVVNDTTKLSVEPIVRNVNLALGDEVYLSASGAGGSSILKYTWDFDKSDGIQVDAEGKAVRRKFRKAGTYTVTVTVTDHFGLKEPATTTITAVVNP